VVAGARELVRQRLGGHHVVGSRLLSVEEALGLGAITPGEVGGLDKGPRQVGVAVLDVAFPLLLAIRQLACPSLKSYTDPIYSTGQRAAEHRMIVKVLGR